MTHSKGIIACQVVPLIFVLILIYTLFYWGDNDILSKCNNSFQYERYSNPDNTRTALVPSYIRTALFIWGTRFFLVAGAFLAGYSITDTATRANFAIFGTAIWVVGYYIAEYLLEFTKDYLMEDTACSKKQNGLSGHLFFITWSILMYSYFAEIVLHSRKSSLMPLMRAGQLVLGIILVGQGIVTFYYGYHSLQQILFGAFLGVLFASITMITLDILFAQPQRPLPSPNKKKEE